MSRGMIVFCADASCRTLSLIGRGAELAALCGASVTAVLLGREGAESCIWYGADRVLCLDVPASAADDEALARTFVEVVKAEKPGIVLADATVKNRAVMPMTAALLGTGLTADCTDLDVKPDGSLISIRPAYGSHLTAWITCRTFPQMATVRPGVFPPAVPDTGRTGEINILPYSASPRVLRRGFVPSQGGGSLTSAAAIVSGGVGIGSREGFETLRKLAEKLRGCTGATRGAVNAGFAPYEWQIGQSGVVVRPKLYIAVGISGAVQHLAGMSGAETIIAINSDKKAPIFRYADYGMVTDWREAVPRLTEIL